MDLHQIQVTYLTYEDRILLRVSFRADDGALEEIRAWLTRRIVKSLWPNILRSMDSLVKMTQPQAAHASTEILGMQHQASVMEIKESGNFDIPFEATADRYPIGETPLLVSSLKFQIQPDQPVRISFNPNEREGFEVCFTQRAMHGFCKLLEEAVTRAEWDVDYHMPNFGRVDQAPQQQRLLN